MFLLNGNYYKKIVVYHQRVLFAMHLLKILNTISCTAQVLLFCVKWFASAAQLPGNRFHCASDKKKIDWFLNVFLTMTLTLMLCFFSASNHLLPCPTVSVNFYSLVYVLFDRHMQYEL